ncbi:MAG: hypothetical protein K6E42_03940 [Synergistes sp.]|nr:hypothetical protein [Synergistes sp.]
MKKNKILALLFCAVLIAAAFASLCDARTKEDAAAALIGEKLRDELCPEKIEVQVSKGCQKAWIRCRGSIISGLRVELMELSALLSGTLPADEDLADLAGMISDSNGKMILLENDVNNYFADGHNSSGFSDMRFRFRDKYYTASGRFESDMLFTTIELDINARGTLALRPDGIYLDSTEISVEGKTVHEKLASFITDSINPLLAFGKISFPVRFSSVSISAGRILVDGSPGKITAAGKYESTNMDKGGN